MPHPIHWIQSHLERQLADAASDWLSDKVAAVQNGDPQALFLAFAMAPRKVGKADWELETDELVECAAGEFPFHPDHWSIDQATRTLLVLSFPSEDESQFVSTIEKLFATGEVGELVALYQALPLLPFPACWVERCAEGIRTNMKPVFCAVAHHNPYPAANLSEDAWNQMVLKCLFIGVPLYPVLGLADRANPALAKMLFKYAQERWAAHREVNPELWRCVGPFADEEMTSALKRLLTEGSELEQRAAELALAGDITSADWKRIGIATQ
ncbi:EboA domain-containing protein [Calycomorphotria hydatis]|nr:EboA domain-containing protein [Calycomorphotria hydatis]